ncbi:hypothetical protein [Streptomonospora wellingtoniae]|uniref:Type IV toxin-antitoxin system AbiEi family antitoxin domain-containing protein n=1 Tax=Streptomonospora wellingtoniae TaxID=3075544 RepID=A0ABU2KZW1_9ACTN|nr:hypothetical protein [Streptomonospora sp. DSM 45055]MDT0304844.1 hypothetical protein [Streptomonospora sp. DSM 45055]
MIFKQSLPCQGDEAVALFAAAQFGLISRAQARRAGLSADDVAARLRRGMWTRTLHWGVYRVKGFGALASPLKRAVVAAQLALAPGAFACRDTAARLWRLDGLPPWDGCTVDMGVRSQSAANGAVSPAVRIHRLRVSEADVVRRAPIRLTGVARTLRDMSTCSGKRTRTRLCGAAVGRGLVVSGGTNPRPHRRLAASHRRGLHAAPAAAARRTGRRRAEGAGEGNRTDGRTADRT